MTDRLTVLPTELLLHILSYLTPTPYIQSHHISLLLLNKRWLALALPLYHASLRIGIWPLRTVRDITSFPSRETALGEYVNSEVKDLWIRLEGPWGEYLRSGYRSANDFVSEAERARLEGWVEGVNAALQLFCAKRLAGLTGLESVRLELSQQDVREFGRRWEYVHARTVSTLVSGLARLQVAKSELGLGLLSELTLDGCGSELVGAEGEECMCSKISALLPTLRVLRIRMRTLCARLFRSLLVEPPSNTRLETLIIKLNQPFFTQTEWTPDYFLTQQCPLKTDAKRDRDADRRVHEREKTLRPLEDSVGVIPLAVSSRGQRASSMEAEMGDASAHMGELVKSLIRSGKKASKNLPKLKKMYLSVPHSLEFPLLLAVDCCTGRMVAHPESGFSGDDATFAWVPDPDTGFAYDDDGRTWWWEDEVDITSTHPRFHYPGVITRDETW